jgi:putative NADH-flavin reductase
VVKVLIIGASRGIGLETVKAALEAGHSVRALAWSARRIPIDHRKLEKMAGDALNMATVKRALSEVDVVIQSLGLSAGPEIILKPTRLFSKATRVLVTAMEEAQVKRLICVTGFGAGDSRGRGGFLYSAVFHLLLGRVYDDKDVQEWVVRRSKLHWVIVRPVILTDGPKTNAYRALVDPRGWTCGFISSSRSTMTPFCIRLRFSRADVNAVATRSRGLTFRRTRNSANRASKFHALILGGSSRSLCQKLRLSEMVLIDRPAFCTRAAYPTISRCTRAASFCSISLNICSSAMSFSISCTEVPDTRCSSEPILLAASSLSFCCGTRGAVAVREITS